MAYDQIIKKKKACLYNPSNTDTNLCFSMCLVRHMHPQMTEDEVQIHAQQIHTGAGFNSSHKVSLSDVSAFENHLGIKILVFHHNNDIKKLDLFQTHEQPHSNTAWLYLNNDHYYMIQSKTVFFRKYLCVSTVTRVTQSMLFTNVNTFAMCVSLAIVTNIKTQQANAALTACVSADPRFVLKSIKK